MDVATYKAEFLSHYYARRVRPRAAYALGLVPFWARVAAHAPWLANAAAHAPLVGVVTKQLAGVHPRRDVPRFAAQTFRDWFVQRGERNLGGPRVLLWPDTFTNFFEPRIARAAVEVLEGQGVHVTLPTATLCCGRPLYDYGMLALAKRLLNTIILVLGDEIATGVPVVGLEPSCVAVLRDELRNLLPHDQDAARLARQTYTLAEFLTRRLDAYAPPSREQGQAVVQVHCHQRAIMKFKSERRLLEAMGLEVELIGSCCGMAGSFGYEHEKYDVSMKIGEDHSLTAIRNAHKDALILADGFSCRSQIRAGTGRQALHVAELLLLAQQKAGARDPERALTAMH